MDRRNLLRAAGGGMLLTAATSPVTRFAMAMSRKPEIKAIAFDAFPVFDPQPVFGLIRSVFPDRENLGTAWFNKIFSYTWLRTSGDRYADFYAVAEQALDYTATQYGLSMTTARKKKLMGAWFALKPWPDIPEAISMFERQGIRLAFLSNLTEDMLRASARNSGIEKRFEYLSTDRIAAFKPAPRAYEMGVEHFGLPKENIAFCAFAAWDAIAADWFGYPTVWVNRSGQQAERLDQGPVAIGMGMGTLSRFVDGRRKS